MNIFRYRSRGDFDPKDWRLNVPRFSEENFPKILKVVDGLTEISKKYPGSTPSSITIAWILAEHKTSMTSFNFGMCLLTIWISNILVIPLPGSRTVGRVEDVCRGAEIKLDPADVKMIRNLVENVDIGDRYMADTLEACMDDSLPLDQWKGE